MRHNSEGNINIGIASLVLILIVFCLTTLGLLSISSAKNDLNIARKNADYVKEYYKTLSSGQEFIKYTDSVLIKNVPYIYDSKVYDDKINNTLGTYYDRETHNVTTDISMNSGLALRVVMGLNYDKNIRYSIESFNVYIKDNYEIDQTRPIWKGYE